MNKKEHLIYVIFQNKALIVILLIAIVLRNFFCRFAASVFALVFNDMEVTWSTLALIWLTITCLYVFSWKNISSERNLVSQRTVLLLFISALFYSVFRGSDEYVFKSLSINSVSLSITLIDAAFCFTWVCEIVCMIVKYNKRKEFRRSDITAHHFQNDFPSKDDKFNRAPFAKVLVEKIISTFEHGQIKEGSFNILLNERYGMGKSSFINIIKDECKKDNIDVLSIKPWKVSGTDNTTKYFLETLASYFGTGGRKLKRLLINYADLLGERISPTFWNSIESVIKKDQTVDGLFVEIQTLLSEEKSPLVVFIDDVDRLQVEELGDIFNLIRNTADFPNIVYIVAADKEALVDVLNNSGIQNSALYLQKFFNFELLFPADDGNIMYLLMKEISGVLDSHGISIISRPEILSSFSEIKNLLEIFHCPRDIYRYSNLLSFDLDMHAENMIMDELFIPDLLKLLIIKYLDSGVYRVLRDFPGYLLSFNASQFRYNIKKEYSALLSQGINKRVLQSIAQNPGSIMTPTETSKDLEVEDISDAIKDATPSSQKIIADLLKDMFSSSSPMNGICYESEYYKYFAGNYSKTQISYKESRDLFFTQQEEEFMSAVERVFEDNREDSFIHQIMRMAREGELYDLVDAFRKMIYLFDTFFSKESPNYRYPDKISCFNGCQIRSIIQNVFLCDEGNKKNPDTKQFEEFEKYIGEVKELDTAAIFLHACRLGEPYRFIFGDDVLNNFQDKIRHRFINERMQVNPFDRDNIKSIPMIRVLNEIEWEDCFRKLALTSECPLEWLYRIITIEGSDLKWNYDYFFSVYGEYSYFADIAKKYFSGLISDEIEQDLIAMKDINNRIPLLVAEQRKHPFVMAAKNWLQAHDKVKDAE